MRYYVYMKKKYCILILISLFSIIFFRVAFADDFQDGLYSLQAKDYGSAYKLLYPLAKQGNALAQLFVATMYEKGQSVPLNKKEAAKWYRLSAEQGNAEGQVNLGRMYAQGHGVPEDDKEAGKWFRLSAEQGNARAQGTLGARFERGVGVQKDYVSAHMWYNLAASNGNTMAEIVRYKLEEKMTPQQITQAQDMARNWKSKK